MKQQSVPPWSFLAIEPLAKLAKKKLPVAFAVLFAERSTLAMRRHSFWQLFESIAVSIAPTSMDAILRQHLAVQFFYALLDISERQDMPDREMQRWQNAVVGRAIGLDPLASHAVVHMERPRASLMG